MSAGRAAIVECLAPSRDAVEAALGDEVLLATIAARASGLFVIGFTGRGGGDMAACCDLCLRAPADATPLIQQLHITIGHLVSGLVEERLFPRASAAPLASVTE